MPTAAIEEGINNQIQVELASAYTYLSMAAFFDQLALPGCTKWMQMQAREEMAHAMRLYQFLLDRGGKILLQPIEAPLHDFGTPRGAFETALEHERKVTASIHKLYALAVDEKDFATQSHLHWFIDEQVEEEKNAAEVVDAFARAGEDKSALLLIDHTLGQRRPEDEEA